MCGFTGYFDPNFEHNEKIIEEMSYQIKSRGPDSCGFYIDRDIGISLGHRRLSIQDLSENGSQPMQSNNKRLTLVFNGEIYNHHELRNFIYQNFQIKEWKGSSDTETLLSMIENFGLEKSLQLIQGMFAFAILDSWTQKLYLCRDRFGEKPLYYGINRGVLFFGSQPKSFRAHPKWIPQICMEGLNEYFVKGYICGRNSIYKGIYKLPPANFISINLKNIDLNNIQNYWEIGKDNQQDFVSSGNLISLLDSKINQTVSNKIISDRKIGSFLSGGIDSSLITYYLQKQFTQPIDTFTIGFEDLSFDESASSRRISNYLGTNHHEEIFNASDINDLMFKLPRIWDEPFSDPSQLPTLLLSELATRNVKVAFSGDGGDELFCGYTRYNTGYKVYKLINNLPVFLRKYFIYFSGILNSDYSYYLLNKLPEIIRPNSLVDRVHKFQRLLQSNSSFDYYSEITSIFSSENPLLINKLLEINEYKKNGKKFEDYREYMIHRDIMEYLPEDILTKVDRASMYNGLEVRVPFLDHNFASWAYNIPLKLKTFDGAGKWPLRKLLSTKIPKVIFQKPKKGFGIPLDLIVNNYLKDLIYETFSKEKITNQGLFSFPYIDQMLKINYSGKGKLHNQIWALLVFQNWYQDNF